MSNQTYILLVQGTYENGFVHAVEHVIQSNNLEVVRNGVFVDRENNRLFKRMEVVGKIDQVNLLVELYSVLPDAVKIQLIEKKKKDIIVFATKEHHCLADLLVRNSFDELHGSIKAVISNYDSLRDITEKFEIPFYHIDAKGKNRDEHEKELLDVVYKYNPDYIVLAKYMRILTPKFVETFEQRIINIHHSFLPAFIGANPYKQAYDRGVKIIGATAHFVTAELDNGPIIGQETIHIDHTKTSKDMVYMGRESERNLLSKALIWVFNDKVFVDGNKTVILD